MENYLEQRNGVYYFRMRVPHDVKEFYAKSEIRISLGTKDKPEAKRRLREELGATEATFAGLRNNPVRLGDKVPEAARKELAALSFAELVARANWVARQDLEADELRRRHFTMPEEYQDYRDDTQALIDLCREAIQQRAWRIVRPDVTKLLSLLGISFEIDGRNFNVFSKLVAEAHLKAGRAILRRLNGEAVATEEVVPQSTVYVQETGKSGETWKARAKGKGGVTRQVEDTGTAATSAPKSDDEAVESMVALTTFATSRNKHLAGKTVAEMKSIAVEFDGFLTGRNLLGVRREDCQAFVSYLSEQRHLSAKTVEKKIALLRTSFQAGVEKDWFEKNPASELKLPQPSSQKKARIPYDMSDLKRLFGSGIYSQGERPIGGRGEASVWLPAIALFSGARLEEIAQLSPDDVYKDGIDKVWVIRFTDMGEGQRLKTAESNRLVPVHRELVRIGFLRFVAHQRKAGKKRLFHELTPDKFGTYSASWSKWWGRYARASGVTDTRKVFHSFRHLVIHLLRRAAIQDNVVRALVGHAANDVHSGYGGEDFPLPPKVAAMAALKYPGLKIPVLA